MLAGHASRAFVVPITSECAHSVGALFFVTTVPIIASIIPITKRANATSTTVWIIAAVARTAGETKRKPAKQRKAAELEGTDR